MHDREHPDQKQDVTAAASRRWQIHGRMFAFGPLPWLMGIVNATPDSFSDGGQFLSVEAAVEHGLTLADEGACILDVGGESTRPGAQPVGCNEELRRVIPVVERLAAESDVLISIDTTKSQVAKEALAAGASIVNDISGLTLDPQMPEVCGTAGVICMHMQGTPLTMQIAPRYDDVVEDICTYFAERLDALERAGISREQVVLDPGIGFGKTADHNLEILSHIGRFHACGRPLLIGHSRKRFLSKIIGRKVEERTSGTVGVSIALAMQGTEIIRVHDVGVVRDAVRAWKTISDRIDPASL